MDWDWDCSCGFRVFASKEQCPKCSAWRSNKKHKGSKKSKGVKHREMRKRRMLESGAWDCRCGHLNYSWRKSCGQCSEDRAEAEAEVEAEVDGGEGVAPVFEKRHPWSKAEPGDWNCPQCDAENLSDRATCFSCGAYKPERRAGDWDCACGLLNYADRDSCFSCGVFREEAGELEREELEEPEQEEEEPDPEAEEAEENEAEAEEALDLSMRPPEPQLPPRSARPTVKPAPTPVPAPVPKPKPKPATKPAVKQRPKPAPKPATPATKPMVPATKPAPMVPKAKTKAAAAPNAAPARIPPGAGGIKGSAGSASAAPAAPGGEAIKALSRASQNFKKSWMQYCKSLDCKILDPGQCEPKLIEQFLDYTADLILADLEPPLGDTQRVTVTIPCSVAERVKRLNQLGLKQDLRLQQVATHLLVLEEQKALKVLGMLELVYQEVSDPNEFVRTQALLMK
ncbi:unnamed protein product [Effrenium voratum]|uniref:RanBP2-type domain-containing protein n=1 Tax=Effrenium voratum TaxID=2562239 RepID=A0AA36MZJ1_9DINO|nr:unnamed protein product [Effrenium voratum]CAJ1457694.1 unnamed protein product [Effrenium voratum]